jgi:hypothetical protein
MNPNQTSTVSAKGRAERPPEQASRRALVQNLIMKARLWWVELVSRPYARAAMIFVAGFVVGLAWNSYGGAARKAVASWSPHLSWLAPTTSSERIRSMELNLATARQSLNKLANEMSRLEAQGGDGPQRRSGR